MTIEKKKKIIMAILGCASLGSLVGCDNQGSATAEGNDKMVDADDVDSAMEIMKNDSLKVDQNKCIGCGKCARIASNNFEMNGRKARVVSQEITSQASVTKAVNACPTNAILQ